MNVTGMAGQSTRKRVSRKAKVLWFLGLVSLAVAATPVLILYFTLHPRVYESPSPANVGTVMFYGERDFGGNSTSLCVRDYAKGSQPLRLIEIFNSDMGPEFNFDSAFWSGDGTVVAVRSEHWPEEKFSCAYDFQKHKAIKGQLVKALVAKRGGEGATIKPNDAWHLYWGFAPYRVELTE
jgi:hypothetical protein